MKIRIGIEGGRRPVLERAQQIGAPLLVSANSLWNNNRKAFSGWACYGSHDVALDSGGFIAMKLYGGYRWTVQQYVSLAKEMNPAWWAQMDFCCEPEIAADRTAVFRRIESTAEHLHECREAARAITAAMPMPVLQGWSPDDYCQGPIFDAGYDWPALVGIGSVCRRSVRGACGILAVINALDKRVPDHVQFHLFGVKSEAIESLMANFPRRIASVDSMAWNYAARMDARKKGISCDGALRADYMAGWYGRQRARCERAKQMEFTETF